MACLKSAGCRAPRQWKFVERCGGEEEARCGLGSSGCALSRAPGDPVGCIGIRGPEVLSVFGKELGACWVSGIFCLGGAPDVSSETGHLLTGSGAALLFLKPVVLLL